MRSDIDSSTDAMALRYPIGQRVSRDTFTSESRDAAFAAIRDLPAALRHAVFRLSDAQLDTPYRPNGWTVRQVVHHLADAHVVMYARVKLALTEDNPPVTLWDEVEWAELLDSREMPIDVSLAIVDAIHARFAALLALLTPHQLGRTLQHPVWGTIPVDELVELCAWHGRHHVAHISGLRERSGW
jgi:hypothetical protein